MNYILGLMRFSFKKRKRFVVVGLGRFGLAVAKTLQQEGMEVIGIDSDQETVERAKEFIEHVIRLDATDERALRAAGVAGADVGVVSIGVNIQSSILVALLLKELGIKTIIAKAIDELHGKVLQKIGVDRVVYPEIEMGVRVARSLVASNIFEQIELAEDYSVAEVLPPKELIGKTIAEARIRNIYGVNVIAIKKRYPQVGETGEVSYIEKLDPNPEPNTRISDGDTLIVFGSNKDIARLRKG